MKKFSTAKVKRSVMKIGTRGISVILASVVVIGTLAVTPFITDAIDKRVINYPMLSEAVGNRKPTEAHWSYNIHEYAEMPEFVISDKSFEAPNSAVALNGDVTLEWTAFSGADCYDIKIYNGNNELSFEKKAYTSTSITVDAKEFEAGNYQVQIIAFNGSKQLAGSMIRPIEYSFGSSSGSVITALGGKLASTSAVRKEGTLERAPGNYVIEGTHSAASINLYWKKSAALPEDTQAIALWVGQELGEDGSYVALNFEPSFVKPSGVKLSSGTKTVYFAATNENANNRIISSNIASTSSIRTTFGSDKKHGEFIEGWVIFPLNIFTDAGKQKLLDASELEFYFYVNAICNYVMPDGTIISDKNYTGNKTRKVYSAQPYAVSDINAFLDQFREKEDNSYAATGKKDFKCDTYSSNNEFYNSTIPNNKYVIDNGVSSSITFNLTDDISGRRGMQLDFTAEESGYYDLSQKLSVEGNSSAKGNVYYRVIRKSDNKTFYPDDANWLNLAIDSNNPTAQLSPQTVWLDKGDKLRIEAYCKLTSGNEVRINIGQPTATFLKSSKTAAGDFISYTAYDYYYSNRALDNITPYYINDRFEYKILNYKKNVKHPEAYEFTKYNKAWSNYVYYNDGVPIIGFLGMEEYKDGEKIKFKATDYHAPQLSFVATESGNLNMVIPIKMAYEKEIGVRILKNDEQIWPKSGFEFIKQTTIKADTAVTAGDKIYVQMYTNADTVIEGYTDPVFSITSSDYSNSSYGTVYSPLWERPYANEKSYLGEYTARPASLFSFGLISGTTFSLMDSFDSSKGNYLFSSLKPDAGYKFGTDDLTYSILDNTTGMALRFTAPESGKYDLSTTLSVVSGSGLAAFKVTVGDDKIWPLDESEYSFRAEKGFTLDFPALQVALEKGEELTVIATATPENNKPVVINLGTPVIYRIDNQSYNSSETTDIYTPYLFTAFEKGKISERLYAKARYEYIFTKENKDIPADIYNTAESSVTLNNKTGFKFNENGAVNVLVKDISYVHKLRFVAPKEIKDKMQFAIGLVSGNAQVRVMSGDTQLWPESGWQRAETAVLPVELDLNIKKGDTVDIEVKASEISEVSLGVVNITDVYHETDYDENTVIYSALNSNPFYERKYNGYYKRYDNEYWYFDIADIKSDGKAEYIVPDKYSYGRGNYLYSTESSTGYYFGDTLDASFAELTDKNYGISLGFKTPRDGSFIFRTGLYIKSEDSSALLKARLTVNGDTVWCDASSSGWAEKTAATDEELKVPLHSLELKKGDIVRFEVYAENMTAYDTVTDGITVSLVYPEIFTEAGKLLSDSSISAAALYPFDEFQYRNNFYQGRYYPIENRWNYEFITVNGEQTKTYAPDYYDGSTTSLSFLNNNKSPKYNLRDKTYTLNPSSGEMNGINLRYTSSVDSETIISAVPKIISGGENSKLMFRILADGKKIWPTKGDWEIITGENSKSTVSDRLELELKVSDDIEIQLVSASDSDAPQALNVSMEAFAAVVHSRTEYRTNYTFKGENTKDIQLDPFWDLEYATDHSALNWERLTGFGNSYYNISPATYCGINQENQMFGLTNGGTFTEMFEGSTDLPILAATLKIPANGFYKMGEGKVTNILIQDDDIPSKIRITVNNKKVWPEDRDWQLMEGVSIDSYKGMTFQLEKGDKLRFEVAADTDYEGYLNLYRYRVSWNILVSYSQFADVYTDTDDIFNMLTSDMYEYFQKLLAKKNGQFDEEYAKHLAESLISDDVESDEDINDDSYIEDSDGNDPEWVEGTEDQIIEKPGKKRKTIKRYLTYYYPVLEIVLISIAVLLIAAAIVIFILHKKGKINWFAKKKIE